MILLVVEQSWAHHMSIVGVHAFHLLADDALVNSCNVRLRIWQERCIEADTCAFGRSVMTVPVQDYVSANACMVISRVEQKRTYHSVSAIPFKGLFFLYFSPQCPALSRPSLSLLPSYGMIIAKEFVTKLTEKMHQGSVTTYSSEVPVALEVYVLLEAEIAVALSRMWKRRMDSLLSILDDSCVFCLVARVGLRLGWEEVSCKVCKG